MKMTTPAEVKLYTRLYQESLTEDELKEALPADDEIISNLIEGLLVFMSGDGAKILRDDEAMNVYKNDIMAAIDKGLFKPNAEDEKYMSKLNMRGFED